MLYISPRIRSLIDMALDEDEVGFDVASAVFFASDSTGKDADWVDARLVAKQDMTLAGVAMVEAVFERVDPAVTWTFEFSDGQRVRSGEIIARGRGRATSILPADHISRNCLRS